MKSKTGIILLLTSLLCSCGGNEKEALDANLIGYQYEDVLAPIVKEKDAISFEILAPKNTIALNYEEMEMFKSLHETTNVKINWDNRTHASYAAIKNELWSDTKNIPDAIYCAGYGSQEILRNSRLGNIISLSEFIEQGKMPYFKRLLDNDKEMKAAITQEDGKIYTLPRVEKMGLKPYPNLLFINKNWIQEAIDDKAFSLEAGETLVDPSFVNWTNMSKVSPDAGFELDINEFETLLEYFKTKHKGCMPLSFVLQNWQGNQCDLYGMFGSITNTDHKIIHNGNVELTATTNEFKNATKKIGEWINKGYINKLVLENSNWTQDRFLAYGRGTTEQYGAFYWWDSEEVVANPENYVCLNPIKNGNNQYASISSNPEIEKGYFCITKACKNPDILATWIDRSYEPKMSGMINYGPIGIEFEEEKDEKGRLVFKALKAGETESDRRLKNAPIGLCYLGKEQWDNDIKMEDRAMLRLERIEKHVKPFLKESYEGYPVVNYTRSEQNKLNEIETNIYDLVNKKLFYWLEHPDKVDSEWDDYKGLLKNAYQIDEWIKINQSAYQRAKSI